MNARNTLGMAVVVMATTFACKGKNTSNVKTLDQMASGKSGNYLCAAADGNAASSFVQNIVADKVVVESDQGTVTSCRQISASSADKKYCSAVQDVLKVIDEPILQNYFQTLGGTIKVSTSAVKVLCQGSFADPNSPQFVMDEYRATIDGCWSMPKSAQGNGYALGMIHIKDESAIRSNGLRVFGMFYGQALQQLSKDPTTGKYVYNPDYGLKSRDRDPAQKKLWDAKINLASVFLQDVARAEITNQKSGYSLNHLPILNEQERSLVRNSDQTLGVDVLITDVVRKQRFIDTVLGEAFDSAHCGAVESKTANQNTFQASMNSFAELRKELNDLVTKMNGSQVAPNPSKSNASSYGLADGGTPSMAFTGGGGLFGALLGMFGGGMTATNPYAQNPYMQNPNGMPAAYNPQMANYGRTPQSGFSLANIFQAGQGLGQSSCYCANGNCANCTGGCAGGNCSCPGGCCNVS